MKTFKIFSILAVLLAAFFALGGPASARSLADSGIGFINGVFASGNAAAPLASTNYQVQGVVGEVGLSDGVTNVSSANYQHQPGFLASSISTLTPTPTRTPIRTPTRTPIRTPTPTPTKTPVVVIFQSAGSYDGWILESTETSNLGGTMNATAVTFVLGDNAAKKQYRGILSFNTGALPDNAIITGVILKVKQQGIVGGGNPVATFQGFMVDIKNGLFGTSALQITDFQTLASHAYGPFSPALVSSFYSINLTGGKADINKLAANSGLTQIRLRFKLDDNNNSHADYLALYSGNAPAADRPQLVVTYYVP